MPAQTLAISSTKMHSVILSAPMPPYSSGKTIPSSPSSPSMGRTCDGELLVALGLLDQRRDLALGELADHLAQVLLLLREGVAQHAVNLGSGSGAVATAGVLPAGSVARLR